jgi:TonB family protein
MSHPDLRRIHALLDGRLDGGARSDFERHLRECQACAAERASLERLRTLARRVVATAGVPDVDWDRLEGRLLTRIAAAGSAPARAPWWRVLVPAAIAAGLVLALSTASQAPHSGVRPNRTALARQVPDALRLDGRAVHGVVTLLQGRVRWAAHTGDPLRALTISSPVGEGSSLGTSSDARIVVQTAPNTGFQLAAGSNVEVLALRETGAVLRLEEGAIANRVEHLDAGEAYRVVAGELLIEVRGTRFDVRRDPGRATVVSVTEGVVAVRRLSGRARGDEVLLSAPAEARFEEGAPLASAVRSVPATLPELWLRAVRGPFAALRLPALPEVTRIEVDGVDVGTGGSLLRHARGTAEVVVYPLEGDPIRTEVGLDRSTVAFRMPEAHPDLPATARPAVGRADRDAISRAMAGYSGQVRRCYDRRLKRMPTLRDRIELRITIGTDGTVTNAALRGDGHDAEVSDCVLTVARRWTFQAPQGGAVTVSVPFNFAPRGHAPDGGP